MQPRQNRWFGGPRWSLGLSGWKRRWVILMPRHSWGLEELAGFGRGGGRGGLEGVSVYFELAGTSGDAGNSDLGRTSGGIGNS